MDKVDEAILVGLFKQSGGGGSAASGGIIAGRKFSLSFFYNQIYEKHPLAMEEFQARISMLAEQGYLRTERAGKRAVLVSLTQAGADYAAQRNSSTSRAPLLILTGLILALMGVTTLCVLLSPAVMSRFKPPERAVGQEPASTQVLASTEVLASTPAVASTSTPTQPAAGIPAAPNTPTAQVTPSIAPIFVVEVTPPAGAWPTAVRTLPPPTAVVVQPANPPPSSARPSSLVQFTDKQSVTEKNMLVTIRQPLIENAAAGAETGFNQLIQGYTNYEWATVRGMSEAVPYPGGFLSVDYTIVSRPEWSSTENPTNIGSSTETLPLKNAVLTGGHEVVSVVFAATGYTGGAHPGTSYEIINYDFTAGKQLQMQDLFRPGMPYLDTIASYAIFELSKQESQLFPDYRRGAAALPENYRLWGVTPRGLLIIFSPYQVAPGASGAQYVVVPYTALAGVLDPQGPLGRYAQ